MPYVSKTPARDKAIAAAEAHYRAIDRKFRALSRKIYGRDGYRLNPRHATLEKYDNILKQRIMAFGQCFAAREIRG